MSDETDTPGCAYVRELLPKWKKRAGAAEMPHDAIRMLLLAEIAAELREIRRAMAPRGEA